MTFAVLEIWELVTGNDYERTHEFANVDVRYGGNIGTATRSGAHCAELHSFEDDPITVDHEIVISGVAITPAPRTSDAYAYWRLVP